MIQVIHQRAPHINMVRFFKYNFSRIYNFYRDVLHVRTNTHYYASFVLSLLIFANVFVLLNLFTLLFSGQASFNYTSPYFILIGNLLMLFTFIIVRKGKYIDVIKEIQALPADDRKVLTTFSNAYITLSILVLLPLVFDLKSII